MVLTPKVYLIVLPMVFLAALVDAIAGGGGLISLPAYTLAGLDYDFASGNNKFSSTFGTLTATIRYLKSGKVMLRPALIASALALPGSWLGTQAAMALGNRAMRGFMVFAIPIVGAAVLVKGRSPEHARPFVGRDYPVCALIGLVIGFYDGFFGPGTGTFLILLFTNLLGMDMVTASATCKPVNLTSNIAALVTRVAAGDVVFALALPAVCCSVTGGWIGAKLALTRGARFIRWVMLAVLALLTVRLAVEWIGGM
ncbi:MAG: TSUP family transporter [Clostridia bacterium]|nr:TSUP family transporter [Clostridia bacterium]